MNTEVVMPPLGETMDEGTIVEWLKQEGDFVEKGEPLLKVETDKTTIEVESYARGFLNKILVHNGATAKIGSVIAIISDAKI